MGVAQGVLVLGVAAFHLFWAGAAIAWAPIVFTAAFSAAIGVFMCTYRDWSSRGRWYSRIIKLALVSAAFAYPVILLTKGLWSVSMIGNLLVLFNVGLYNAGNVAWQALPQMFEKYRHHQAVRPLLWGFRVSDVLGQGVYLITGTLRMIALLIPTWFGYIPMLIGIVAGIVSSYWYARKNRFPEAARMIRKPLRWLQSARKALIGV
jgi:hypothetical protein